MSYRDLSGMPDYSSEDGAKLLIERIKAALAKKGLPSPNLKPVYSQGEYQTGNSTQMRGRFDVRSDMVDGYPRKDAS